MTNVLANKFSARKRGRLRQNIRYRIYLKFDVKCIKETFFFMCGNVAFVIVANVLMSYKAVADLDVVTALR